MNIFKTALKKAMLASCVAGASVTALNAATISTGHVDIGIAYEDGAWDLHIHNEETDREYEPGDAVLRVNAAAQTTVPSHPNFSFLGTVGEPVWILPAAEAPNLLFLGLATEEIPAGTFVSDQVKLSLKGVTGPGHFALYTVGGFGTPSIRMNSRDGISSADFIHLSTPSHAHANYAFSAPGLYTLTFEASGILNDGSNTPTFSGDVNYSFLVVADSAKPTISIATPANNIRTNTPEVTISGIAKDDGKVAQVLLDLNGSGFVPVPLGENSTAVHRSYSAAGKPGTNTLLVKAVDATGKESSVLKRTFFYVVTDELTLTVEGSGSVLSVTSPLGNPVNGASLEIGRPYKVKAVPGAHHVFSNWTGSVTSSSPVLDFIMQSNMVLQANFIPNPFIPAAGIYNGLFLNEEAIRHTNSGFITLKVNTNFSYSGKLFVEGNAVSVSGKFALDGTATRQIDRSKFGKTPLTLNVALDFAGGTDKLSGTLSSSDWTASVDADRARFSKTELATGLTGDYTFLLPGFENAAQGPSGYGFAAIKVASNGLIKASGGLPDANPLKQSVAISAQGRWPFYAPLYPTRETHNGKAFITYKGSIINWLTVSDGTLAGQLHWQKTSWTNAIYSDGFQMSSEITGSPYSAPAAGNRALDLSSGWIEFDGGNLLAPITSELFLKTNNTFVVSNKLDAVVVKLNAKSGLISGSFKHPVTSAPTKFNGAVLQNEAIAAGVFSGTDQTGAVLLQRTSE